MMCVRAIYENVREGNTGDSFNLARHWIQMFPRHHQDIASDDGELTERLLSQDDGHRAKLPLLSLGFAGCNSARDDHRIVTLELRHGRADTQAARAHAIWQASN